MMSKSMLKKGCNHNIFEIESQGYVSYTENHESSTSPEPPTPLSGGKFSNITLLNLATP